MQFCLIDFGLPTTVLSIACCANFMSCLFAPEIVPARGSPFYQQGCVVWFLACIYLSDCCQPSPPKGALTDELSRDCQLHPMPFEVPYLCSSLFHTFWNMPIPRSLISFLAAASCGILSTDRLGCAICGIFLAMDWVMGPDLDLLWPWKLDQIVNFRIGSKSVVINELTNYKPNSLLR
jgi:hypothetical protein